MPRYASSELNGRTVTSVGPNGPSGRLQHTDRQAGPSVSHVTGYPSVTAATSVVGAVSCKNHNNNNLRLVTVKTNHSTSHTVYNIQQSATQGSNDTTHTHAGQQQQPGLAQRVKTARKTAPSYLPTIRSDGPLHRKHSSDGATRV